MYSQLLDLNRIYKEALDWANSIRAGKGLEPLDELPKGRRKLAWDCPLAKAIQEAVHILYVVHGVVPKPINAPNYMFAYLFDLGLYPQFEETPKIELSKVEQIWFDEISIEQPDEPFTEEEPQEQPEEQPEPEIPDVDKVLIPA